MSNTQNKNIYYVLRDRIANIYYKPGDHLYEKKLAEEFGVSRTPVREAIIRLKQDNLVIFTQRGGATVSDINLNDFQKLIEVRLILERGVSQLAVRNVTEAQIKRLSLLNQKIKRVDKNDAIGLTDCDTEYHKIIAEASDNPFLIEYLSAVRLQFTRIQKITRNKPDGIQEDIPKAIKILKNRDTDEMIRLSIAHVEHFIKKVRNYFRIE